MEDKTLKKEISRLRSEVHKIQKQAPIMKDTNPFTGAVMGNYWSQAGLPWVSGV